MYVTHGANKHFHKTTKGWQLCVEWKDGTTSWERLTDLKESNPIEVAEFATAHGLQDEPAFIWWVPYTLKQCNQIISAVNKRSLKRSHKFGIELPCTYDDCVCLDQQNNNTLWQDTVHEEMSKVQVAFQILNDSEVIPLTYQMI